MRVLQIFLNFVYNSCMFSFVQKIPTSSKPIFLGVILIFLLVVLFCGHFQVLAHMSTQVASDCMFLANYLTSSRGDSFSYVGSLILLIALAAIIKTRTVQTEHQSMLFCSWNSPLTRITQFVAKLYNPLLEALRRGILHPQIYSSVFITG